MPSINGIDFNSISSLSGVSWNSVSNIGGVSVSHAVSCTIVSYGYSDGLKPNTPSSACLDPPINYDFDSANNLLYVAGGCGVTFAIEGFYSDGVVIYRWDGFSSFSLFAPCGR